MTLKWRRVALGTALVVTALPLWAQPDVPPCRRSETAPVRWIEVDDESDRREMAKWCDAVGPPVVRVATPATPVPLDASRADSTRADSIRAESTRGDGHSDMNDDTAALA